MEPALSNANIILQTILAPPFIWRWNRFSLNFACDTTQSIPQDYLINVADFGFIESAAVFSLETPALDIKELQVKRHLERTAETGRPTYISPETDDGTNILFRLQCSPDKDYPVTVTYQKKPILFTSLGSVWAPVPDEMAYVFNNGFLALSMLHVRDERFGSVNQKFLGALLSTAQGLTEMERNLFLGNWLMITGQLQAGQYNIKQGNAARGV
jgi:hypothetical protein